MNPFRKPSDSLRQLSALIALFLFVALLAVPSAHAQFVVGNTKAQPTTAGGTVTQATSRTTGVTLNTATGAITTNTASLAAAASATFTVTNASVGIKDVVVCSIRSGATNRETRVAVTTVANGSFQITVHNQHASTAEVGAIVINYAVFKAVLN